MEYDKCSDYLQRNIDSDARSECIVDDSNMIRGHMTNGVYLRNINDVTAMTFDDCSCCNISSISESNLYRDSF